MVDIAQSKCGIAALPRYRILIVKKVGVKGLEPLRPYDQRILSP
jgi:hypothetical protein